MTLYHIALGTLYGVLFVLIVASLAATMLSSHISRDEDRAGGWGTGSHSDKEKQE